MFTKFKKTAYLPSEKPVFVWDGECGFCKYWVTYWEFNTEDKIEYKTFQNTAAQFKDIPLKEFKKASRLIETDGSIFSGPDSAYRSFTYFKKKPFPWHSWYKKYNLFAKLSDHGYNFIAKNRAFMFTVTKLFFGKNPLKIKPYWLIYLFFFLAIIYVFLKFL